MSGIEVAGIALAVFPIVVKGIACYSDAVRAWRRYRREIDGYRQQLETQRVSYLDTLEELLGFVDTEEDLNELIANPRGASWRKPEYEQRLRERLGHSYDIYLATIQELLSALEEVRTKLGVGEDGKVPWENSNSLRRIIERLKHVFSKRAIADLFEKIEKSNATLREFTHQNCQLEKTRKQRRLSKNREIYFSRIRKSARSLHRILVERRDCYWKCVCRQDHIINIQLEPRAWDDVSDSQLQNHRFRLLFSLNSKGKSVPTGSAASRWKELEIAPVEILMAASGDASEKKPNEAAPSSQGSLKRKRAVRFAASGEHPSSLSTSINSACASQTTVLTQFSKLTTTPLISDICTVIHSASDSQNEPIGFILDDEQPESHRHDIFAANNPGFQNLDFQTESLADLLSSNQKVVHTFTRQITRRDSLQLAVVIAVSVLPFDGSWLRRHWSSHDIHFTRKSSSKPILDRPYISCRLESGNEGRGTALGAGQRNVCVAKTNEQIPVPVDCASADEDGSAAFTADPDSPNSTSAFPHAQDNHLILSEALFPLGLTLIELSLGHTITDCRLPEDNDSNEAYIKLKTASRLLNLVYSKNGPRYGDVVKKCLHWTGVRDTRFENHQFQKAVFEHVVMPLVQDLRSFDGMGPIV